jgi:hypothetical protein
MKPNTVKLTIIILSIRREREGEGDKLIPHKEE